MSTSERKARKKSGEKFQPKPAKIPTTTHMPKADQQKARRAFQRKMSEAIAVAKEAAGRG